MPSKQTLETLLKKHLPKESASVLLKKVNKMVKQKATPVAIQKAISQHIIAHVKRECKMIPVFTSGKPKLPVFISVGPKAPRK